ncbi:MAG: FAD-dependent oxidoreductase [Nitrosomonadales bacterium]|nr:FAD-dependent oxidoreductase [Nitrosomonadales bacterium]
MAEKLNVGVIGGGYAGMAAAAELASRNIPVTVFESAQQLGGRARGVYYNDTRLDNGQHLLLGCYRETLRMIELVGGDIDQDFLRLPLQLDLHDQFSLRAPRLPAPLHLLIALLSAQGLTWSERIKAASFMLTLRNANFRLDQLPLPQAGEGRGEGLSDITVSALLAQHKQDADLTFKLWEPLCIAALNTPIQKASAHVLLNVLRDALNQSRADSDMLLPRIDFTALFPQRAASFVERRGGKVHTSCGVEAIRSLEDEFEIITTPSAVRPEPVEGHSSVHVSTGSTRTEDVSRSYRFSHVICAAPPVVAAKLLRPIAGLANTVAQIDALEHQPIYTLYLQYPAHVTLPHPMIGLHRRISQWLFDKGQIAGQHGLLAAVISAEGIHQELSQDELAQKVIAELRDEFGIAEQPQWFKVIAEKRATFCCSPNLQRPAQQTALPRLLLAGDYTAGDYPATLEGAVMSGVRCADLIRAQSE